MSNPEPKWRPVPPCVLPALWRTTEIKPLVNKIVKAFECLQFSEAAKLCVEISSKAAEAKSLFLTAASESRYLMEGQKPPKGIFQPIVDSRTGKVLNGSTNDRLILNPKTRMIHRLHASSTSAWVTVCGMFLEVDQFMQIDAAHKPNSREKNCTRCMKTPG